MKNFLDSVLYWGGEFMIVLLIMLLPILIILSAAK